MRIINNTGSVLQYVITQSGTTLSGSRVIASGGVMANSATVFQLPTAGINPIVYVKAFPYQGNQGFIGRQVSDANATVNITITEE
jgi:hypothetical protein